MKIKESTKLTIFQAVSFISACVLALIFYGWKLIPILILYGWANNAGMIKSLKDNSHKDKEV